MTSARQWLDGARPRTLPAAIAPVAAGCGLAAYDGSLLPLRALLCLVVALALQVGVNYANDYSDGVAGTDAVRTGPRRLTASGTATASAVRRAAFVAFATAAVAGTVLAALSQAWWLLVVGAVAIASAWLYTGGPRPYGYAGFGEVFVFVFFGLVAVMGTAFVQTKRLTWLDLWVAVPIGLLACALLVVNNLRDIETDPRSGKHTLAVRLGARRTRGLYVALMVVPFVIDAAVAVMVTEWALLGLAALPFAIPPIGLVLEGAHGRSLLTALRDTGRTELAFGLLVGLGLLLA